MGQVRAFQDGRGEYHQKGTGLVGQSLVDGYQIKIYKSGNDGLNYVHCKLLGF